MESIFVKWLNVEKPIWANYAVMERFDLDGFAVTYFEVKPFVSPFTGKYITDSGKTLTIYLSEAINILFEL